MQYNIRTIACLLVCICSDQFLSRTSNDMSVVIHVHEATVLFKIYSLVCYGFPMFASIDPTKTVGNTAIRFCTIVVVYLGHMAFFIR